VSCIWSLGKGSCGARSDRFDKAPTSASRASEQSWTRHQLVVRSKQTQRFLGANSNSGARWET
jgi:hypothetical protein